MSDLSTVEEYAIWLAETGIGSSVDDDMNEGCDPISERGQEVSEEDWRAALVLAHQIGQWVRSNPAIVLTLTRESVVSQETTAATTGGSA